MILLVGIVVFFLLVAGISDLILHQQDKSLNRRFRENQRIHHRRSTP